MIIVEVVGGLGNQMFDYLFYLALKERRGDVRITDYWFSHSVYKGAASHAQKYLLADIFALNSAEYADDKSTKKIGDVSWSTLSKVRRRIFGLQKKTFWDERDLVRTKNIAELHSPIRHIKRVLGLSKTNALGFNSSTLVMKHVSEILDKNENAFFSGYWQDFAYAQDIEDKVRQEFTFKKPLDERNQVIANQMVDETEVSVSIHVRRGDYLLAKNSHFARISEGYYERAMNYFTDRFSSENVHFYVFSNDITWCRENLKTTKITFIDWNTGDDSYRDMQLMSLCKHNIIANSSFSTWGAWLNANPSKIVIRPKFFSVNGAPPIPTDWIVMDN